MTETVSRVALVEAFYEPYASHNKDRPAWG